ncbi:MAG: non-canonical purine NTP pyrophosphatase [Candidatus Jorgensenbacteria bacterium]|nr:non-canonical purine NTP pyrophosphatase [Candidatus Jorgensenbacteria bacterium]
MTIYLVTKNPFKLSAAKSVFDKYNIEIEPLGKEYPEIQSDSSLEIARSVALQVAKDTGKPVIREDHSFFINYLGIPGPYMSYIDKRISPERLIELLDGIVDRSAYFEVSTVYANPDGTTIEHTFKVPAEITDKVVVKDAGWDGLIRLSHEKRVLAEGAEEERYEIFGEGYRKIAETLIKNK